MQLVLLSLGQLMPQSMNLNQAWMECAELVQHETLEVITQEANQAWWMHGGGGCTMPIGYKYTTILVPQRRVCILHPAHIIFISKIKMKEMDLCTALHCCLYQW